MNNEEMKKLKHDLKRPFNNLQMLLTILKGTDMEKERLISSLEKILSEGQEALNKINDK